MKDRQPAVAGIFYPADPEILDKMISGFLDNASTQPLTGSLKGIIGPHAGYVYSGPTAAFAYKLLSILPQKKYNVFILAPSHFAYISAAVGDYEQYLTPMGAIKVNRKICEELRKKPEIEFSTDADEREHSLEVQLPFLQKVLKNFEIVPILLGETSPEYMYETLQPYFSNDDSLFVVSSDLSHYHPYETAKKIDRQTLDLIMSLDTGREEEIDACGNMGIKIMMRLAKNNKCKISLLDYRNSGDTAGDKNGVVGYGALAVTTEKKSN